MVPFSEIVAEARRKIDRDHGIQDREEIRVQVLAHAPDFSAEDRAQMIAALMAGQPPAKAETTPKIDRPGYDESHELPEDERAVREERDERRNQERNRRWA